MGSASVDAGAVEATTMRGGLRLGRLFGIEITLDTSVVFVVLLLTWNLTAVFGRWHPRWSPALSLGVAVLASLLFLASILVHELAHAFVARGFGIPVGRITLWLFGGVSSLEREPSSPRAELLSAAVGPLTSALLGVGFIAAALAGMRASPDLVARPTEAMASLGPASTLLLWLGPVNLMLAAFNLLPAFPLDGGRVLRAILWRATGQLRRATRIAAAASQLIAVLLIVSGFAMAFGLRVPVLGTGLLNGLWLAFIGWFLHGAAHEAWRGFVLTDVLRDVPVARLMRTGVPVVAPGTSTRSLVFDGVLRTDARSFPVVEAGQLVGTVSIEQLRALPRSAWDSTPVERIMTPADALATAHPSDDAASAVAALARLDLEQLPVVDELDRFVGVLHVRDVARWLQLQPDAGAFVDDAPTRWIADR